MLRYALDCLEIASDGAWLWVAVTADTPPTRIAATGLDRIEVRDGAVVIARGDVEVTLQSSRVEVDPEPAGGGVLEIRVDDTRVRWIGDQLEVTGSEWIAPVRFDGRDIRDFAERGSSLPLPSLRYDSQGLVLPAALAMLLST